MENFDLKEELKKLPDKPGVYLMHDAEDHIIYVGKAVILKNRVRQYFQKRDDRTPKIERMISQIAWFEYVVTDSETEALVLECNLIKEYHPKYNTMLMDDKGYPYIRVTVEEAFQHPDNNIITRGLGDFDTQVQPDIAVSTIKPGDMFMLCSDGLYSFIGRDDFIIALNNRKDLNIVCRSLVDASLKGGSSDNTTIVAGVCSPTGGNTGV